MHRSSIDPVDRTRQRGIPVTASARTILDLAAGCDPRRLERAIDQAITDELLDARTLRAGLDGYRWHRTRGRQESDRRRETALRRLGYTPLRYSAAHVLDQPLVVVADLVAALVVRRA